MVLQGASGNVGAMICCLICLNCIRTMSKVYSRHCKKYLSGMIYFVSFFPPLFCHTAPSKDK